MRRMTRNGFVMHYAVMPTMGPVSTGRVESFMRRMARQRQRRRCHLGTFRAGRGALKNQALFAP
jgi:hypothetical protein